MNSTAACYSQLQLNEELKIYPLGQFKFNLNQFESNIGNIPLKLRLLHTGAQINNQVTRSQQSAH